MTENQVGLLLLGELYAVAIWALCAWLDPKKYKTSNGFIFTFFFSLASFYVMVWLWNLPY